MYHTCMVFLHVAVENSELVPQTYIQYVSAPEQENLDPQHANNQVNTHHCYVILVVFADRAAYFQNCLTLISALQQIVMVQPLTITADGQLQLQDGQAIDASQIQILSNDQQVFDTSAVHASTYEPVTFENQTLQQLQYDASTGQLLQVSLFRY